MKRSAGIGIVAVLPGNHEEFLRWYLVPSRGAVWGTRFSILSCTKGVLSCTKGVWYVYDWDTWSLIIHLVEGLNWLLPYASYSSSMI